jgi:hypothetical protein
VSLQFGDLNARRRATTTACTNRTRCGLDNRFNSLTPACSCGIVLGTDRNSGIVKKERKKIMSKLQFSQMNASGVAVAVVVAGVVVVVVVVVVMVVVWVVVVVLVLVVDASTKKWRVIEKRRNACVLRWENGLEQK